MLPAENGGGGYLNEVSLIVVISVKITKNGGVIVNYSVISIKIT